MQLVTREESMMIRPPIWHCFICGAKHCSDQPHDPGSAYYERRFLEKYGRRPTWADAVAHLPPAEQLTWKTGVYSFGGEWDEPPAGCAPIAEPMRCSA